MSSCLSGGGRTYGLELEIIKSSSTCSTRTCQTSSSPSSTLSESSNSPLAISTRKPRTPRKRPNQTYNEAAALLSTAYPNIFSKPRKFTNPHDSNFFHESSELLVPFRGIDDSDSGFLLQNSPIPGKPIEPKLGSFCPTTSGEVNSHGGGGGGSNSMETSEFQEVEDFDAESILDEEIEQGIDSIMGNLSVTLQESSQGQGDHLQFSQIGSCWPMGLGLGFGGKFEFGLGLGLGLRGSTRGIRALRHVDEGNWWNFPTVDVLKISPKTNTNNKLTPTTNSNRAEKKKKKVADIVAAAEAKSTEMPKENQNSNPNSGLQLKLNYQEVVTAWSDRGSPFSDESPASEPPGNDVYARLAQIDLFSDGGGVREASVLRYKEKRRTRLFSKKIRYQVRKVNADQRPRMKGRFVRRPNSSSTSEER
ncbi:hypothetical protein CCACVL1_13926 [Corchorus capsularis]|uniref:CCT domain-containing protein n=1 Tax=Corchorus capsularis TaxID=210143 RepID=A0A1R3I918_COCAP|nr:hypothetical protein CCACVL1_13926 [Corchorus capsularis]